MSKRQPPDLADLPGRTVFVHWDSNHWQWALRHRRSMNVLARVESCLLGVPQQDKEQWVHLSWTMGKRTTYVLHAPLLALGAVYPTQLHGQLYGRRKHWRYRYTAVGLDQDYILEDFLLRSEAVVFCAPGGKVYYGSMR